MKPTLQLVRSTEIQQVLARLSPEHSEATRKHFLEELSYEKVAAQMNLPFWEIKRRLAEALGLIRELWGVRLSRIIEIAPGYELRYFPHFLKEQDADSWFERLQAAVRFRPEVVTLFGKQFVSKRQTAQFGGDYHYNETAQKAHPWSLLLAELRTLVEKVVGWRFDSALCNLYPDNDANIGWHADSGHPKIIASLSLGATREIRFAPTSSTRSIHKMKLCHGSLLLIPQSVNDHFKHTVPKTTNPTPARINITFRSFPEERQR